MDRDHASADDRRGLDCRGASVTNCCQAATAASLILLRHGPRSSAATIQGSRPALVVISSHRSVFLRPIFPEPRRTYRECRWVHGRDGLGDLGRYRASPLRNVYNAPWDLSPTHDRAFKHTWFHFLRGFSQGCRGALRHLETHLAWGKGSRHISLLWASPRRPLRDLGGTWR